MPGILTIGHSTRTAAELIQILAAQGVELLVDVRTVPRSRHNPQFDRSALPANLDGSGIEYRHEPGLGGLRKPVAGSVNAGWRNASFRGYADYMQSPAFEERLGALIERSRLAQVAIMCAESVPWRCHRSLIADALTVRGIEVLHLMAPGKSLPHRMTPFARVDGARITYPGLLEERKP